MRPTIRDVARRAGVSIATVSRVMHDHEHVSPATRDRVAAAVAELEFTPSRLGRSLAERRHAANGIVFPDLSGPYYAEVVLGYEVGRRRARPLGADPLHPRPRRRPGDGRGDGRPLRRHGRDRPHRPRRAARAAARPRHAAGAAGPPASSRASTRSRPRTPAPARRSPSTSSTQGARSLVLVGDATLAPDLGRALGRRRAGRRAARRRVRRAPPDRRLRRGGRPRRRPRGRSTPARCPTRSSAPTTSSPSACSAGWPTAGVDVPGRRPRHRLGRHHGRPLRRPHHRPPADARPRRDAPPASSTRSSPAAAPNHGTSSSPRSWSSEPPPSPRPPPLGHLGKVER